MTRHQKWSLWWLFVLLVNFTAAILALHTHDTGWFIADLITVGICAVCLALETIYPYS